MSKTYTFDGETLTFAQIRERVPLLATKAKLEYEISRGRDTKAKVIGHDPAPARRAGGMRGAAVVKGQPFQFSRTAYNFIGGIT